MNADAFRLVDAALSDPGKKRAENEDSFYAGPQSGLWAVADGMGGHDNGQWASRSVVRRIGAVVVDGEIEAASVVVADALHGANAEIYAESTAAGRRMGSTAAALLVRANRFAVLWVGDSRVYLLREGVLHRLTRDHTQVQELVDRGLLSPADAAHHQMSHILSRAVGAEPVLELDAFIDEALPGDVFMLCSDGLSGIVSDLEIASSLASNRPRTACERLMALCLERGAPDNVTVVTVACDPLTVRIPHPANPNTP